MERVTWDSVLLGLDETLSFCRALELGKHVDSSRFLQHRTVLLRLMGALASGGPEMARAVFAGDPMASFLALTEAVELGGILPFLKACKPETVRRKLLEVLQGPAQVTAEDQNTNQGRNILFEFNVAAKLCDAKLSPQLGDHPDVSCSVDGREIFIECKRPLTLGGAAQAMGRAFRQLENDLKEAPAGARGAVAFSVSRLLNPGNQILSYTDEIAGKEALSRRIGEVSSFLGSRGLTPGPGIVGILWLVITPAVDRRTGVLTCTQFMNVEPICELGSTDERLFARLYEGLRFMWDEKKSRDRS